MASVTLRVSESAHRALRDLSRATGEPMSAILDEAVEEYRRKKFLEKANEAFAKLKLDPEAWARELEERRAWEATLEDGLEEEGRGRPPSR